MNALQKKIQKSILEGKMPRQGIQPLARRMLDGIKKSRELKSLEVPHPAA